MSNFVDSFNQEHELPRAVTEMWRFASQDTGRSAALGCILLEPDPDSETIHAVATDGHILVHQAFAAPALRKALGGRQALIRSRALKLVGNRTAVLTRNDLVIRGAASDGSLEELVSTRCLETDSGLYPLWRECLPPKASIATRKIALNPRLLRLISDYASFPEARQMFVAEIPEDSLTPVRWRMKVYDSNFGDGEVELIMMPMRLDKDEAEAEAAA